MHLGFSEIENKYLALIIVDAYALILYNVLRKLGLICVAAAKEMYALLLNSWYSCIG